MYKYIVSILILISIYFNETLSNKFLIFNYFYYINEPSTPISLDFSYIIGQFI